MITERCQGNIFCENFKGLLLHYNELTTLSTSRYLILKMIFPQVVSNKVFSQHQMAKWPPCDSDLDKTQVSLSAIDSTVVS